MSRLQRIACTILLTSLAITAIASESASEKSEWRRPNPENLIVLQLPDGSVVIELAPVFAPASIANIKTLVRERYYDGLAIIRSQDNYVVQWGDPADEDADARPLGSAAVTVTPEFTRPADGLDISTIDSRDAYADVVGFADGLPVGSDGERAWLTHCYGMVGVARGTEPDSGNGSSLYVVTGHAPRHLDRNITLVGRVVSGIEELTTLPRGTAALGFYESADEMTPIVSVKLGSEIEPQDRPKVEILRTDSDEFSDYVRSRTYRNEDWFVEPTGRIEICNLHPPTRPST